MSDCNGSPCRDWVITLSHDGQMTNWGWAAIVILTLALCVAVLAAYWLFDRLT